MSLSRVGCKPAPAFLSLWETSEPTYVGRLVHMAPPDFIEDNVTGIIFVAVGNLPGPIPLIIPKLSTIRWISESQRKPNVVWVISIARLRIHPCGSAHRVPVVSVPECISVTCMHAVVTVIVKRFHQSGALEACRQVGARMVCFSDLCGRIRQRQSLKLYSPIDTGGTRGSAVTRGNKAGRSRSVSLCYCPPPSLRSFSTFSSAF